MRLKLDYNRIIAATSFDGHLIKSRQYAQFLITTILIHWDGRLPFYSQSVLWKKCTILYNLHKREIRLLYLKKKVLDELNKTGRNPRVPLSGKKTWHTQKRLSYIIVEEIKE